MNFLYFVFSFLLFFMNRCWRSGGLFTRCCTWFRWSGKTNLSAQFCHQKRRVEDCTFLKTRYTNACCSLSLNRNVWKFTTDNWYSAKFLYLSLRPRVFVYVGKSFRFRERLYEKKRWSCEQHSRMLWLSRLGRVGPPDRAKVFTTISRKVVGKMCTRQSRKAIWDMFNTLFLTL